MIQIPPIPFFSPPLEHPFAKPLYTRDCFPRFALRLLRLLHGIELFPPFLSLEEEEVAGRLEAALWGS